MAKSIYQQH